MENIDIINLAVKGKLIGMLIALVGGFVALVFGIILFFNGAGFGRDRIALELGNLKLTAHSIGSVVMITAIAWAFIGYLINPNIEKRGDDYRIYSMSDSQSTIETPAVTTKLASLKTTTTKPEELKELFTIGFKNLEQMNPSQLTLLDGKPASVDLSGITTTLKDNGGYLVSAKVTSGKKSATLTYEPKVDGKHISFIPKMITSSKTPVPSDEINIEKK